MSKILPRLLWWCLCLFPGVLWAQNYPAQLVVASDGSGDYSTIQGAIEKVREWSEVPVKIILKPGIYREKVHVPAQKVNIQLIGENPQNTIVVYNNHVGKGDITTYSSYTFKVEGHDFYAEGISFVNDAGPVGQAVAMHVDADRVVFKNCRFIGNQDTLFVTGDRNRQFFMDCEIEGTTDFIFGSATAVFQNCTILAKKNSFITAASTSKDQAYGLVFLDCKINAEPQVSKLFLGRPWRMHAKTVFVRCELPAVIHPEGWSVWNQNENHKTAYYAEYASSGPGANSSTRANWSHQLSSEEVLRYTLEHIFKDWKSSFSF
ncbi:MAG: pectin esterase [Pedobacter sp.]|nr:MAG: pectin esterase [Pedobacter sp.]